MRNTFCLWILCSGLLSANSACATVPPGEMYQEGQLIDVKQKKVVTFEDMSPKLLAADVIYIGEAHYTPSHIEAALRVLQRILDGKRKPILGMEMFSWDGQEGLDRYINGDIETEEQFLAQSRWNENWGGKYEAYAPLVEFAKKHALTVLGLNPPRVLVRKVASNGLGIVAQDPAFQRWGFGDPLGPDDPEYRRVIYDQIEKCHSGLSQEVYQRIYEASVFRDEGMAHAITSAAKVGYRVPVTFVSYTGGGHIQYGLPIPKRVTRQLGEPVQQLTLYLHALDPQHPEDVNELQEDGIADYLWLTPLGPQGPQPRCGG